jgi:hypothetical protein
VVSLRELKANAKEYLEDADYLFNRGHHNSALNLYFKALVAICDYIILQDTGKLPRNTPNASGFLRPSTQRYTRLWTFTSTTTENLHDESHKGMGGGAEE